MQPMQQFSSRQPEQQDGTPCISPHDVPSGGAILYKFLCRPPPHHAMSSEDASAIRRGKIDEGSGKPAVASILKSLDGLSP
jgi:hypothetical protein